jgi:hypothetical protein
MTKGRGVCFDLALLLVQRIAGPSTSLRSVENHFQERAFTQIPPLRSPEFLSRLVALANFMRLSLMKAAHVDLSDVAKQEFGYAPGGMTRGEERFQGRRLLSRSRFSSPWVGRRPIYTSVGMTNLFRGPVPIVSSSYPTQAPRHAGAGNDGLEWATRQSLVEQTACTGWC